MPPAHRASRAALPVVVLCSIAVASLMAFGNPYLWMTNEQAAASQAPQPVAPDEAQAPVEDEDPDAPEQVIIGQYQAISQSEDAARAENIRLAADAIDGTVVEPGATFSFNEVVGDSSAERGYQEAPVIRDGQVALGDGGGICQVSTALYIAAVKADLEIVERHPHSVVSDYAPPGLDATIVYGQSDLRIKNDTDHAITIYAKAVGQTVDVSIIGDPLGEGVTVDATSRIVDRYEKPNSKGEERQYYVAESFRVYYQDGVRTTRDLLSCDIYLVDDSSNVMLVEGSVEPSK
ncbi:MAG: VanW family protein [Eggerthellaceae bacterium]|nr:VanW family protein [Eggerthellaceae bacterium]